MKFLYILSILLLFSMNISHAQIEQTIEVKGVERNFILYVPNSWELGANLPLVFVLHGFTQTAQNIMQASGFNEIADENGFFVIYPNGINRAWNTNIGPSSGGSSADDVAFINALIDLMAEQYRINMAKVYSCGFSAGGFMSYRLACELSDRITSVASVGGTVSLTTIDNCSPSRPIPIMQIHGTNDFIVSYNGAMGNASAEQVIDFWTAHNKCMQAPDIIEIEDIVQEGSTVEKYTYASCDSMSKVVLFKVINGGHTWPGARSGLGLGNTNRDIDASLEIWKFFSGFSHHSTSSMRNEEKGNYLLFPNPVESIIYIYSNEIIDLVEIVDLIGNIVKIYKEDYSRSIFY